MPEYVRRILLYLFSCGPFVLVIAAWLKLYLGRKNSWPRPVAVVALAITSVVAVYSAALSVYYAFRPVPPSVPGWEDPSILGMAMLFFLAPITGIFGLVVAGKRAGPGWLIAAIEIASVPLFILGVMASFLD